MKYDKPSSDVRSVGRSVTPPVEKTARPVVKLVKRDDAPILSPMKETPFVDAKPPDPEITNMVAAFNEWRAENPTPGMVFKWQTGQKPKD